MQKIFKILTLTLLTLCCALHAATVDQKVFNTHLRWMVSATQGQVDIKQKGTKLLVKTLDADLYNSIKKDLVLLKTQSNYIKSMKFDSKGLPNEPAVIDVDLKDQSVELFSFYKNTDRNYIIDFWINEDLVVKTVQPKKIKKKIVKAKKVKKKVQKVAKKVTTPKKKKIVKANFRDFRYGSSFIWDKAADLPELKNDINLALKAPNFLYKIKDRNFSKDSREAHMQLSINFYKQSKWGLMTKSISLYEKKYGTDLNKDTNDFMKAVSLIKNQINPKVKAKNINERGTFEAALNILSSISSRSSNYDLKKATTRYVLQASVDKEDYVSSLQLAKRLYVLATEELDDEAIIHSSKVILTSLAKLKQVEKIKEFLENKAVARVLPKQVGFAFMSYVKLSNGDEDKLISDYEKRASALVRPIHPSIIYNVAEAYFRAAKYSKAIALYDDYVANYSHLKNSSITRGRLALSYDLMGKNYKQVSELYKTAINKSSDVKARYEAKIRYVGHRLLRNYKPEEKDFETVVFLDQNQQEKAILDKELKKLLWLTRLRVLIVSKKYNEALAYLSSVPLVMMPSIDKNVFEADGAEIVLGVIKQSYLDQNYAKAIKVWNVYKAKYVDNIAKSPYLRFLVTDSYLKLGLNKSFNDSMAKLSLMGDINARSYPRWVSLHKKIETSDFLIDIKISKLVANKLWTELDKYLESVKSNENINYNFYKALVSYKRGFYNKAIGNYEKVIVAPNLTNTLSPLENQTMLSNYIESLYEAASPSKFRKNVKAIVADLRRSDSAVSEIIERSDYLLIESLFDKKSNLTELALKTSEFLKEFKDSNYKSRIKYVSAITHLNRKEINEGKIILEELLKEKDTPEYLKGLARSELTGLVLENKKL